jgi:hypothetical protein
MGEIIQLEMQQHFCGCLVEESRVASVAPPSP